MKIKIETTELDFQPLEQSLDQIEQVMGEEIARPLRIALSGYLTVLRLLEEKGITLRRLRRLLGLSSERTSKVVPSGENSSGDSEPNIDSQENPVDSRAPNDSDNSDASNSDQSPTTDRRRPGHGRNPAAAYVGCKLVTLAHQGFRQGDTCPDCGVGTLYRQSEWAQVVRLTGRPPVGGVRYELERLRCGIGRS